VKRKSSSATATSGELRFSAEAAYADSIFRQALGDLEGSIAALKRALEAMPTYAPAILSMGSVWYQTGKNAEGRELFQSLVSLPKKTKDICQIIDEAGTFLTKTGAYEDGLALYRTAVKRYPDVPALFGGLGYCAGKAGLHEEAVSAQRLESLTGRPAHGGWGDPRTRGLHGSGQQVGKRESTLLQAAGRS
jgi:tetratricopeptide (TPR) repeat protein